VRDRVLAACGVASVALVLAGSVLASAGGQPSYTLDSSPGQVAHELAKPVGALGWAGAYLELLSYPCFLAFAIWACARLGDGVVAAIARAAATAYATVGVTALGVMNALAYRSGHGVDAQLGTALANLSSALFLSSWILAASFLLAIAPLALASGRRVVGTSAVAIAGIVLVATPALVEHGGQVGYFLWLLWVVGASVALPRAQKNRASQSWTVGTNRA
jgi:hypothetical protein